MFTPAVRNIANPRVFLATKPLNFVRYSSSSSKHGGGGGKKFFIGTSALLAGATGALVYGVNNKEFRHKVEEAMPWTKPLFEHTEQLIAPKTNSPKFIRINRDDVDPDYVKQKNNELETALKTAIRMAESDVRTSKYSKLKTITLTREHAALLKRAVDDGESGDWQLVSTALDKADASAANDRQDEVKARNSLDNLKKVTLNGKNCPYTFDNKLIVLAGETAKKLEQQVNELNLLAEAARTRGIMITQYSVLVEQSRKQFAKQLNKLTPHEHKREKELSVDESEAIIAQAKSEVDALHKQLIQQQDEAERRIADAIEAQHVASSKIAKQELETEKNRVDNSDQVHNHPEILAGHEEWEVELKDRLARAELAHEQHMQEVLLMQKQIHDAEMAAKVEEEVHRERRRHARQIGRSQSKLDAMEVSLSKRADMDTMNRRMKYCWLACQNLVNSVVDGRPEEEDAESRRAPLAAQLGQIKEAGRKDIFIDSLISLVPNESIYEGTYTQDDLKQRFSKVENIARNVAYVEEYDAGPYNYGLSYARSKLRILPHKKTSAKDKVDPLDISNVEVLDRAHRMVERNDLSSAVRMMQLLRGEAGRVARDWVKDTRTHLETKMMAHALVAHSAITGIRTTY